MFHKLALALVFFLFPTVNSSSQDRVISEKAKELNCELVSQVWTELLNLYRQQVDPRATGIPWLETEVLNFPFDIKKEGISTWTQDHYKMIKESLTQITFKSSDKSVSLRMLIENSETLDLKREEIYEKLLKIYQKQIDPFSECIRWDQVEVINFPLDLNKRLMFNWSLDDVLKLEASLSSIRFEKLVTGGKKSLKPKYNAKIGPWIHSINQSLS